MTTLLSIVLSNSVINSTTALQSSYTVRLDSPINLPHNAKIILKSATLIKNTATNSYKVLSINIPWLDASSHVIGGSSNSSKKLDLLGNITNQYKYDIRRQHDTSLILTTLNANNYELNMNLEFRVNRRNIPNVFNVIVKNAVDGIPYTNLLWGSLTFQIS